VSRLTAEEQGYDDAQQVIAEGVAAAREDALSTGNDDDLAIDDYLNGPGWQAGGWTDQLLSSGESVLRHCGVPPESDDVARASWLTEYTHGCERALTDARRAWDAPEEVARRIAAF
jgi:hypothetical protein